LQFVEVEIDLFLRVRGQLVEPDAEVAAVARTEVSDLARQVQPRAVRQRKDDVDRRSQRCARADGQTHTTLGDVDRVHATQRLPRRQAHFDQGTRRDAWSAAPLGPTALAVVFFCHSGYSRE